jgi:YtcA-like protein
MCGLQGCGYAASPSLPFYGAYFPSWLLCAALGVLGSVLIRALLIRLGVDDGIPLRTLVYISLAFLIAFAAAAMVFGR